MAQPRQHEFDRVKQETYDTRLRTAAHLREAAQLTSSTEELGVQTLSELNRQGEQLERTQRILDETEAEADKSAFMLRGLKSIFGTMKNKFSKKPDDPQEVAKLRELQRKALNQPVGKKVEVTSDQTDVPRKVNPNMSSRSQEEDELLDQIMSNINNISQMGYAMNDELSRQEKVIDNIDKSMDKVHRKIATNTVVARRIA